MRLGFVIDNRKCIGCHACTVACKSEHDVPVGVNRTWVKQVEKGVFPQTRRLFSVMRCNHCTDAPCVTICPTQALFHREDGVVDFDNRRCIGCKGCMQACPYDALYIDPETNTAAKCNYCAHRVDVGLEPACVNVCPEHAIISGDMDDPNSEIATLLAREAVTARKVEKGTQPNLFYIDGDRASLEPMATDRSDAYFWSGQTAGVGHFSRYAESRAVNEDVLDLASKVEGVAAGAITEEPHRQIDVILGKARRTYDTPDKGLLWGKEVVAYVWTKAIASGIVLAWFLATFLAPERSVFEAMASVGVLGVGAIVSMVFLLLTLALLVADLDKPMRFHYVLLRSQSKSWLVRGGWILTLFGATLTALILGLYVMDESIIGVIGLWGSIGFGVLAAIYTAFLFAQGKGRDFWQSPALALHMLLHAISAGTATLILIDVIVGGGGLVLNSGYNSLLGISLGLGLLVTIFELTTPHPTESSAATVQMITKGRYASMFWVLSIGMGIVLPLAIILISGSALSTPMATLAAVATLVGIWFTEKIWVEAPQRIPLS